MILERLEALPVGTFHYKLLTVAGLGWLFDSMDTGLIAFVLPVLAKDWQLANNGRPLRAETDIYGDNSVV